ncbi:MAG TPA: tail fiber domain-containing protein [Longimicrobium sp.]|nr:tail fiber domain-containing protein [Longimicrobium sp.]
MKTTRSTALVAAALLMIPAAARAQTPDSVIAASYSGNSLFRVNVDGGTTFGGSYDAGFSSRIPIEGSGTRLMWYPGKAAFRAGYINGTQWDDANIGNYSIAIGENVRASGDNGVALGVRSTAANVSSVAIGEDNTASGAASVALGYHAHTNTKQGSFVFSDRSSADSTRAGHAHQATFRVACGFRIFTSSNQSTGVAFGGASVSNLGSLCPTDHFGQSGTMIATSTGAYLSSSGMWTNASDVNRKHLFEPVAGEDVLVRLRSIPIRSWTYRVDADSVRHLGPTAQDFRAAFGLGSDDKAIGTVDADGVALAGVQALDRRSVRQQAEIAAARSEIDKLRAENRELAARLARIEALLSAPKQD